MLKSLPYSFLFILNFLLFSPVYAQSLPALIKFTDSTSIAVDLEMSAFQRRNSLKDFETGRIIPLHKVTSVKVDDRRYVPATVTLHTYLQGEEITQLDIAETDTLLLLEEIRGGTASLYYFVDAMERPHWFVSNGDLILELIQVEYVRDSRAGVQKRYQGIFNLLMNDCPQIQPSYSELPFNQRSFERIIDAYNDACGETIYKAVKVKWRIQAGLTAGYYNYHATFNEPVIQGLSSYSSQGMTAGAFVNLPLSRFKQLFFVLHPYYVSNVSFQSDTVSIDRLDLDTVYYSAKFKADYIHVTAAFKYKFQLKNLPIQPFLEAGVGFRNTWHTTQNTIRIDRYRRPHWVKPYLSTLFGDRLLAGNALFYRLRTGASFNRWEFSFSYSFGSGGATSLKTGEQHRSVEASLGFYLF